jgi:tRNA (cytidine/uridine-2'-O-)-methyltransferase
MHVVLVEPQIPQNTGSVARTCAALEIELHLVEPLGFTITEKAVRRAGLDYWPYVKLRQHPSWQSYLDSVRPSRLWLFSTHGTRNYCDAKFNSGDALVFGSETKGLGAEFLARYPSDTILRLPMKSPHVRSINLSNAVSVAAYEALRQIDGVVSAA